MDPHGRRRTAVAVGTLLVALFAGGCTGDDEGADPRPGKSRSSTPTTTPSAAPLVVRPRVITGTLPPPRRTAVAAQVGTVVDRWFDAAYLGGTYPRRNFANSFPWFSRGATAKARRDVALLSNAAIGPRIEGTRAVERRVAVDLLSPRGRPAAATAHVRLVFDTTGELRERVVVTGKLMLVPSGPNWQVVGYDVARSAAPLPSQPPSSPDAAEEDAS